LEFNSDNFPIDFIFLIFPKPLPVFLKEQIHPVRNRKRFNPVRKTGKELTVLIILFLFPLFIINI